MTTPVEGFLIGYDAFPFGGAETKVPGTLEYRGWLTRYREVARPKRSELRILYGASKTRPIHAPYKPRLSGSDAAISTVLRWLR